MGGARAPHPSGYVGFEVGSPRNLPRRVTDPGVQHGRALVLGDEAPGISETQRVPDSSGPCSLLGYPRRLGTSSIALVG